VRRFASKVDLLDTQGQHLRYVPGELARAMVDAQHAAVANANGKVKSVRLIEVAQTHGARIGEATPPTAASYATKFIVREKLDSGATVWRFHRRSFD
jgi:hypothetical protein